MSSVTLWLLSSIATHIWSSLWTLLTSSTFWLSAGWLFAFLELSLRFLRGQCSENQLEMVMAMRRRPRLTQCTSEVMGMSEKRAWSRHMRAVLHSKSLTMFRISCRSACRIIPRTFSRVETCFFLWGGRMEGGRGVDWCYWKLVSLLSSKPVMVPE